MKVAFLYPRDIFNPKSVDETYAAEYQAAQQAGLSVYLIDTDHIEMDKVSPKIPEDVSILYRGWMLSESSYAQLQVRFGDQLLVSKNTYLTAHYLPHWYEDVQEFTMHTIITTEQDAQEEFDRYARTMFMKDYVKSLKTGKGSVVDSSDDVARGLADLKKYRGCIEGGIVLRDFVELIPHSEQRFFVVHNTIFGPRQNMKSYSFVKEIAKKLEHKQLIFYAVDIALQKNGEPILIEIGDGQVSDYVGWDLQEFISILQYLD